MSGWSLRPRTWRILGALAFLNAAILFFFVHNTMAAFWCAISGVNAFTYALTRETIAVLNETNDHLRAHIRDLRLYGRKGLRSIDACEHYGIEAGSGARQCLFCGSEVEVSKDGRVWAIVDGSKFTGGPG